MAINDSRQIKKFKRIEKKIKTARAVFPYWYPLPGIMPIRFSFLEVL